MTVSDFIKAIAASLSEAFPDAHVLTDKTLQDCEGCFYIVTAEQKHIRRRGNLRDRRYTFDVVYFCTSSDSLGFGAFAEKMYAVFDTLTLAERTYHISNIECSNSGDMAWHTVFSVEAHGIIPTETPLMESLSAEIETE